MSYIPSSSRDRFLLRKACRLWHLQTDYLSSFAAQASSGKDVRDVDSKVDPEVDPNAGRSGGMFVIEAKPETLMGLLQAVSGKKVSNSRDLEALIELAKERRFERCIEPVAVAWQGTRAQISAYLPEESPPSDLSVTYTIELESGQKLEGEFQFGSTDRDSKEIISEKRVRLGKKSFHRVKLQISHDLPIGYHKFKLRITSSDKPTAAAIERSCLLMCAPIRNTSPKEKAPKKAAETAKRSWGGFAPLYSIKSQSDWGIGDFSDMEKVQEFIHSTGGAFFGTLPLLASICESEDCDPSPYSPVSRLFWNEVFLDVEKVARDLSSGLPKDRSESLKPLKNSAQVEYSKVFAKKAEALKALATEFFETGGESRKDYQEFLSQSQLAVDYAEFRSQGDETQKRYHLFVQFQLDQTLKHLSQRASRGEIAGLYLDFPVGVSRGGFDSKKFASSFLLEATAGAPPDQLFSGGQSWGFAPLHPINIREEGYRYFIECIRHHMKYASVLRLDHIMSLHRIYAVPVGMDAKSGSYIRFRPEEFYALIGIEAQRSGVRVVGEDLGTVPPQVREALETHDLLRMWVLPFEASDRPKQAIAKAPKKCLACLNTHDMSPFQGHLKARDIELLNELGLMDKAEAQSSKADRDKSLAAWMKNLNSDKSKLFNDLMCAMAAGPSELLLVNLEDLLSESEPQNIPGTWKEYPNWRRKMCKSLEQWTTDPDVISLLNKFSELRSSRKDVVDESNGTSETNESNEKSDGPKSATSTERQNNSDARRPPSLQ